MFMLFGFGRVHLECQSGIRRTPPCAPPAAEKRSAQERLRRQQDPNGKTPSQGQRAKQDGDRGHGQRVGHLGHDMGHTRAGAGLGRKDGGVGDGRTMIAENRAGQHPADAAEQDRIAGCHRLSAGGEHRVAERQDHRQQDPHGPVTGAGTKRDDRGQQKHDRWQQFDGNPGLAPGVRSRRRGIGGGLAWLVRAGRPRVRPVFLSAMATLRIGQ